MRFARGSRARSRSRARASSGWATPSGAAGRVRGRKPRSAFEQTISTTWVEDAQSRVEDPLSAAEAVVLGLDFGLSSDKHSLAARQGLYHREHPELGVTVIFFNAGTKALDSSRYYLRRDEMWYKRGRPWIANPRCH